MVRDFRMLEWCRLRVKDTDFVTNQVVLREGGGARILVLLSSRSHFRADQEGGEYDVVQRRRGA
jgi:hypothetical protein